MQTLGHMRDIHEGLIIASAVLDIGADAGRDQGIDGLLRHAGREPGALRAVKHTGAHRVSDPSRQMNLSAPIPDPEFITF